MTALLEIRKQIDLATAQVIALEQSLAQFPEMPSVAANLNSAVRIRKKLQAKFAETASRMGLNICSYRAFDEREKPIAGPAFGAIADFQKLVSIVFSSLKYKSKKTAQVSAELADETAFDFGYAFSGSVGVVLTLREERLLFNESYFDESIDLIFRMAKSATSGDILPHARNLGSGAITALYKWASDNAGSRLGADIQWKASSAASRVLFVQWRELHELKTAIDETSDETQEVIEMEGILSAVDTDTGKFKLTRDGLPNITGTVEVGAIDDKHKVTLPSRYALRLLKSVKIKYATGQEETKYHLLKLAEVADTSRTQQSPT